MAVAELPKPIVGKPTEVITDEYLMRLPNNPGSKWELVEGKLREVPSTGKHDQIVIWLGYIMMP